MVETYTETCNAFELVLIAALPASSYRPDCFSDLDCHQNRYTFPLWALTAGNDVGDT